MDVSIVLVGQPQFVDAFAAWYGDVVSTRIAIGSDTSLIAPTQKPDILLIQASALDRRGPESELVRHATYCLAIELGSVEDSGLASTTQMLLAAEALEGRADAYLSLCLDPRQSVEQRRAQQRLLSAQLRVGLRHVQRHREVMQTNDLLSAIALADSLTELSNRRALEWELPRQIQAARQRGTALSLIVLDVDYFKQVNDSYGHLVGDRVLQLLAARLRDRLRLQDTAFRYGGEEFVVLLKQTDADQALAIAQRLRRLIGEQPFSINRQSTLKVTISLGVASLKTDDDRKGLSLLDRADRNLLRAKANGRNQVVGSASAKNAPTPASAGCHPPQDTSQPESG